MEIIIQEISRLERILEEMLDFARPVRLNLQPASINRILGMEKEYIIGTLQRTHWHLGKTCALLGISRPTLRHKLKTHGLTKDFEPF